MPRMREAMRSGWNCSIMSSFSPVPANLMGLPVAARIESAAPPRASPSSFAVDAERLVEGARGVDRILTGHGVDHEENLVRMDGGLDGLELVHELLVDMQAARSVEKHHVVAVILRVADGLLGDMDGIALPHLKDGDVELTADDLQLRDGGGTVHVAGHQQGSAALLAPEEIG